MSEELNRAKEIDDAVKAADAKKRADSDEASSKLDRLLECMDSMNKRMDSFETSMADSKRKGAERTEIKEKGDPRESSVDSELHQQPAQITGPDRFDSRADSAEVMDELANIQTRADRACSAWSKSAVSPWSGEMPESYTRRVARDHQRHSENWKSVELSELRGRALANAAEQIFTDSISASMNTAAIGAMNLRCVSRRNESGHLIKEYFGDPLAWMSQFAGGRQVARFKLNGRKDD
jgi:hypothetical protein